MDQYNEEGKANAVSESRSWIDTLVGILITLVGVGVMFLVASLEGSREIKAPNSLGGELLTEWRESNPNDPDGFPEPKTSVINRDGKDYYFVAEEISEEGIILKWYWAYDGGFEYIFQDAKFYILGGLALVISMYISYINYIYSVFKEMKSSSFLKTLEYYQEKKKNVSKYTQYLPNFCVYKNTQARDETKRDIIESAEISYDFFISPNFNIKKLEKWQRKVLKDIRHIKVKKIRPQDLLQEGKRRENKNIFTKTITVAILPISMNEHLQKFLISGFVQKTLTSALSGFMFAFGIVLGNWFLGLTYGFTILMSAVTAGVIGKNFVRHTLRYRFLGKADLLNEFENTKEKYIEKETKNVIENPSL